jgi:hypothetical protein
MEQLQSHLWLTAFSYKGNICAFPHIWGSPSSTMTVQLLHSEFPYIWGNFDFLYYQSRAPSLKTRTLASSRWKNRALVEIICNLGKCAKLPFAAAFCTAKVSLLVCVKVYNYGVWRRKIIHKTAILCCELNVNFAFSSMNIILCFLLLCSPRG